MAEILVVSHLSLDDIHFIDNPNAGITTTIDEMIDGANKMEEILSEYRDIEMICIHEGLIESVKTNLPKEKIMPIHLYQTYEWLRA